MFIPRHSGLSALSLAFTLLPIQAQQYRITGPYTHANLDVYLVHAQNEPFNRKTLSLQEGMKSKKVVVYETAQVNDLAIENTSADPVFIQAGDIVKGGQQDRVLSDDLLLPPHSGRVSIAAFCVEHGRWNSRDGESMKFFSTSENQVATKELKAAVVKSKKQEEVWRSVADAQRGLGNALMFSPGIGGAVASKSPTSMALTLDTIAVTTGTEPYVAQLSPIATQSRDIVGYAYALNGKLAGADLYPTHELFLKLWPKLLKSTSVEALASPTHAPRVKPTPDDVSALLAGPKVNPTARSVQNLVRVTSSEDHVAFFSESRDAAHPEGWLHRTYLAK